MCGKNCGKPSESRVFSAKNGLTKQILFIIIEQMFYPETEPYPRSGGRSGKYKAHIGRLSALLCIGEEVLPYENDITAEEETESESSRFQSQNGYRRRKKGSGCQKSKGKSKINCLIFKGL